MVSRALLGGALLLCLAACSSPMVREPGPVAAPVPQSTPGQADTVHPGKSLLLEAQQAREAGDYPRAEAVLGRAQRVDPRNAGIYLELARLYDQQGQHSAALAMAERGLLYCDRATCSQLRAMLND